MNKTYSNNAQVPQEEVKAQHNRIQKMYAPSQFVDSFYHMNAKPPFTCATTFCLSLVAI